MHNPVIERLVQPGAVPGQNPGQNTDVRALQQLKTASGVPWIRIGGPHDHARKPGGDQSLRAGRRAPLRTAGFQGDIEGRAPGGAAVLLDVAQRLDFRMGVARAPVPAAPENCPGAHHHRAHHGVGRRRAITAPGQPEGQAHVLEVGHRPIVAGEPNRLKGISAADVAARASRGCR